MNIYTDLQQTKNRFNELANIINDEFTQESMSEKEFKTVVHEYFRLSYRITELRNKLIESTHMNVI